MHLYRRIRFFEILCIISFRLTSKNERFDTLLVTSILYRYYNDILHDGMKIGEITYMALSMRLFTKTTNYIDVVLLYLTLSIIFDYGRISR